VASPQNHRPEIIDSESVLHTGEIDKVERVEIIKIKASISITLGSLVFACLALVAAAYTKNGELQTWATNLISAIAGAAISYGFNSRKS
jgi:cation transporter-like permease